MADSPEERAETNPVGRVNPGSRAIRRRQIKSALAKDKVVRARRKGIPNPPPRLKVRLTICEEHSRIHPVEDGKCRHKISALDGIVREQNETAEEQKETE